jgi:hypothetical protein
MILLKASIDIPGIGLFSLKSLHKYNLRLASGLLKSWLVL